MVINKKILIFVFISFIAPRMLHSSGYGTTGAQIVNLNSSARSSALGYAMGAVDGDPSAVAYNPAGLHSVRGHHARLSHLIYFLDSGMSALTYAQNIGKIGTGIKLKIFSTEDTERDAQGEKIKDFGIRFTQVSFGAGSVLTGNLAGGAAMKILAESYDLKEDPVSATAFAFDLGLQIKGMGGDYFGLAVRNLGPEMKMEAAKTPLDRKASLAGAHSMENYIFVWEISTSRQYSVGFQAGVEVEVSDIFKMRVGGNYITGIEFMGGFGIGWDRWKFDYALVPHFDMGLAHRVSLGAVF